MFKFKDLIELWRKDNFLVDAVNDLHTMFGSVYEMYAESKRSLRESDDGEMKFDVYDMDRHVNTFERQVRQKVLKHLSITGATNVGPGLVLASIVVDVERIGDHTKNIMDLAVAHPTRLACAKYEADIAGIEAGVTQLFDGALPAFRDSDEAAAKKLIDDHLWIMQTSDEILERLVVDADPGLAPNEAVSTALYARYLKQIAVHLINITSSVVNPFDSLGFLSEGGESYMR